MALSRQPAASTVTPAASASGAAAPGSGTGSAGSAATSSVASQVSRAVVDITGTTAGGQVAGTGMVITSDGEVLTNNHVIAGTTTLTVQIDGQGPTYSAIVLGDDPSADIALVKIQGVSGLPTVSFAAASTVSVGDQVIAIGNAGNRPGAPSVTTGTIVAAGRTITAGDQGGGGSETLSGLFQINALLEPGDSGGPLVNTAGQVIGMDTAAQSGPGLSSASSVGFAIPADSALAIVKQIEAGKFGATVQPGHGALLGVSVPAQSATAVAGAQIVGVQNGSPAQAAGMAAGDVITAVGATPVDSQAALHAAIQTYRPGQSTSVTWVDTAGHTHTATVTFASGPPA